MKNKSNEENDENDLEQENDTKTQDKLETRGRKPKKLNGINCTFTSIEQTRIDLTELTMAFLRMEIPEHTYRAAVYGVNSITKLLLHSKVEALEKRLLAIEKSRMR